MRSAMLKLSFAVSQAPASALYMGCKDCKSARGTQLMRRLRLESIRGDMVAGLTMPRLSYSSSGSPALHPFTSLSSWHNQD